MEDFNGTFLQWLFVIFGIDPAPPKLNCMKSSGFLQNKWYHMDSEWHEVKFIRCLSDRAAVCFLFLYT